jgi:hypothetical protein
MPGESFEQTQKSRAKGRIDFRDLKKHYVRVKGWLPAFVTHSDATRGEVRYLTLCAKEAIDVRYFAQKGMLRRNLEANEYPLLTFVESNDEDYAIIAETLGRVRLAVHAPLEDALLDQGHPSHADLKSSFPYHILNLDFCGAIIPQGDHPYGKTLRCIDKVIELQAASGAEEWHLFLTFRAQRTQTNEEANAQLREIIEGNLGREELRQAYAGRPAPPELLDRAYPEFLRISIAKYVAYSATNCGYAAEIESSWVYSRHEGEYHIVKLVAALRRMRAATSLRNPQLEQATYESTVRAIFSSHATDVDAAVAGDSANEIDQELKPVLEELQRFGVVTA